MRTQQCARCKTQVDWPEGETRIAKYGPAAGQRVHVDYEVCLAALRAQLAALQAAGEWRPVTEKPDADMDVEMIVIGMYKSDDNVFWDEYFGAMVEPTHWRPAPPQE